MSVIITSFAQFMPYIFILCVVGIVWDMVIGGFMGRTRL